jgi:hypothetical protein
MLSVVIVGFSWNLILSPLWGVAEGALKAVGLGACSRRGSACPRPRSLRWRLISVWQFVGIPMMLIYASLLNIPEELVDAARVDGLGQFRIFWHIKLPLILPTIGMVSILTFVGNFNAFDLIYAVKGALAGPNFASDILGTFSIAPSSATSCRSAVRRWARRWRRSCSSSSSWASASICSRAAAHAALRVLGEFADAKAPRRRISVFGVHAVLIAYSAAGDRCRSCSS